MWFLIPTALFLTAAALAVKFKESICDTIAITGAMQILVLYLLAIFRGLKYIYGISAVVIVLFGVFVFMEHCSMAESVTKKIVSISIHKRVLRRSLKALCTPSVIVFVLVLAAVTYLTRDQIFTWWDDINFWSSDAKQIYYLGGFSGKYGNVSPEFGDYPPVTSLAKWIFLQISPSKYMEGLQFAGYFAFNAVFLMPFVSPVRERFSAPFTILAFLIPGIVSGIIFYGTPADITMGIVYGALLFAIWDKDNHTDLFYYGRIALYTAVLLLTKSVGIEWALFALLFYFLLGYKEKGIIFSIFFSASFYGSWLFFCLLNRRVAKATGLGIKMATGSYSVPANALEKAKYFFLGLWTMPMHADHNITLDLPIGVMIIIIFVALVAMLKFGLLESSVKKPFALFLIVSAIVSYLIIFIAHISLFQAEDQYLDAFAMTNSTTRYGAPFTIGGLYLLAGIALTKAGKSQRTADEKRAYIIYAVIAGFILLTADYKGLNYYLFEYRDSLAEKTEYNQAMIDDGGQMFFESVYGHRDLWGHRVLNMRSGEANHYFHDAYISKEVSPVPAVYDTLTNDDGIGSITDKILRSHAEYLFVEEPEAETDNAKEMFDSMTEGSEPFEFWKIYKIDNTGDGIRLSKVYLY